ncbi:transcriptional regulator STERILE APETALA-like [Chenopodium quinoa]|uniref:transcriptional regulator STERILE APETALA-like n=1 Tax=Chenopodium quinoa TaxID=63459 RepID=UPI000B78A9BE|nr:transcriptional regulator STERILE APETALA-like [Chenopodium quinoa]
MPSYNVSLVCTTWRAVSRSELLWQNLVRIVWNSTDLLHPTWRDQFITLHRTSRNFRVSRYDYFVLRLSDHPLAAAQGGGDDGGGGDADHLPLLCLRIALADDHLALGFSNGSVRVFHLPSRVHLRTLHPLLRDHLGLFSRAVSGIVLQPVVVIDRVVFASLDGDIHVASPLGGPGPARRAYLGDVVNDGALVDFTGGDRFWVGLYAGVPGRAFRVWDADSEELLFRGGSLTDPESVMGWHMLTEIRPREFVGRIRVAPQGVAVGVTSLRALVLNLEEAVMVMGQEPSRRGIIVGSVDANDNAFVMVDTRGVASVRQLRTLEEVCRFSVSHRGAQASSLMGLLGCMNSMYVVMCIGGTMRVWDADHGEYLYSLREWVEETTAVAANDRHVVATSSDTTIHLWDFGA